MGECADWSVPLLFACKNIQVFSRRGLFHYLVIALTEASSTMRVLVGVRCSFVMRKAWHQDNERSKALALMNSPPVSKFSGFFLHITKDYVYS